MSDSPMAAAGAAAHGDAIAKAAAAAVPPSIQIRDDGKVTLDGILVGNIDGAHVTLNLGWLREAGGHLTLKADPDVDKVRGGIVLDR